MSAPSPRSVLRRLHEEGGSRVKRCYHVGRAGSALELLQHCILLDAGRDNDAGGSTDARPLAGQVDRLHRLGALELIDWQRMAIDAAH